MSALLQTCCFAMLASCVGVTAQAIPITFDFGDPARGGLVGSADTTRYVGNTLGFTVNARGYKGVSLAPLGSNVDASFSDREAVTLDVAGTARGLGVFSGGTDDGTLIDGLGPDEAIRFDFGRGADLLAIQFASFGSTDDFNLVLDGLVALVDHDPGATDRWTGRLHFDRNFAIGADGSTDGFRVRSVTLDVAVPEPTTASPSAIALAAVALLVRRRRALTASA